MRFLLAAMGLFMASFPVMADADGAMAAYRNGDYKAALPLLQAATAASPKDPVLRAAFLSALVYEGKVEEASDAADEDGQAFPNSPEVTAARGEFAYYMGDMTEAERLFKSALKVKETDARACYGLARVYRAASLYRTARLLILRAHQLDPDDALITSMWMNYLVGEKRKELLPPFMAAHPWFYQRADLQEETASEVDHELNQRKAYELVGEPHEATIRFEYVMSDPRHIYGVALDFKIENRPPLKLLFDTGASGVLISQRAVDKAGLTHVGSLQTWGIGDAGKRNAFVAVADTCEVGGLKYKSCVMRATEGTHRVANEDFDGLIGADFFADYVEHIDFQKRELHLVPQPPRDPNPQGYDRVIPPDEKDFTMVFRQGNHLFLPTMLNGKTNGLFLIDTGASVSNVDSTFARLSMKIHNTSDMRIHGISGQVKDVFESNRAVLRFARYQQPYEGIIAFDLNNQPEHQDFRMSGILGIPVLSLFRLSLDYRNALVNFDYVFADKKKK